MNNTKAQVSEPRATVSSIEARRILAVLDDCRSRAEYSLLLPSLGDFFEGRENIPEDIMVVYDEFLSHQHAFSAVMTADGDAKPGRQADFEEEKSLYKDCAREMIRVMKKHSDFFAPLLSQSGSSGGSAVKLISMMRELNDMMNLTFTTPVESDEKQDRLIAEINQRKKTNSEYIEQLKARESALSRERDQKIRQKEDQLDEIKQQLLQAKANETALQQDDIMPEDVQSEEDQTKQQFADKKGEIAKAQKEHADEENKQRRLLRKEEEALQSLISQYDKDMETLTKQNEQAQIEAEKKEKELHELQNENAAIEKIRSPIRHEEQGFIDKSTQANKLYQDTIAAAVKLQTEIRRYLKTAPKPSKKKGKKSGRRK